MDTMAVFLKEHVMSPPTAGRSFGGHLEEASICGLFTAVAERQGASESEIMDWNHDIFCEEGKLRDASISWDGPLAYFDVAFVCGSQAALTAIGGDAAYERYIAPLVNELGAAFARWKKTRPEYLKIEPGRRTRPSLLGVLADGELML
jgi:hypothetical protein